MDCNRTGEPMRFIYIVCLVIFSGLFSDLTIATEILFIRSPQASSISFEAQTLVRNDWTPYAEFAASSSPTSENKEILLDLFEKAEWSFSNESAESALQQYLKVLELTWSDHWRVKERKILFQSALRAAHLTLNKNKSHLFLKRAIYFSNKNIINENLFPPPVVDKYQSLLKKTPFKNLKLSSYLLNFDQIKINGILTSIRSSQNIKLPPGKFLVTVYSSTYQSQSQILDRDDIIHWKPKKKALVNGVCGAYKISKILGAQNGYLFFANDCISSFGNQKNFQIATSRALNSKARAPNPLLNTNVIQTNNSPQAWWKKKWIWYTVAGAGAAYLIYENNRDKGSNSGPSQGSNSPTTVYE